MITTLRLVEEAVASKIVLRPEISGGTREHAIEARPLRTVHTSEMLTLLPLSVGMTCAACALLTASSDWAVAACVAGAALAFAVAASWVRQLRDSPCLQDV